jgi:hypothetical protein
MSGPKAGWPRTVAIVAGVVVAAIVLRFVLRILWG